MEGEWQDSVLRRRFGPVKLWLPRVVVCLVIYSLSVRIIGGLLSGVAFLSTKAGSFEFGNALHQHPFARALFVGILAGLVPMQIWLSISGVFNTNVESFLRELKSETVKPWTWALFSPLFVLDLLRWFLNWLDMGGRNVSVLQTTTPYRFSDLVRGYLSTDCSWTGFWPMQAWETKTSFQCMIHVQMLSLFLLSLGYSLAPIVSRRLLPVSVELQPESGDENMEEPETEGNTNQHEDSH